MVALARSQRSENGGRERVCNGSAFAPATDRASCEFAHARRGALHLINRAAETARRWDPARGRPRRGAGGAHSSPARTNTTASLLAWLATIIHRPVGSMAKLRGVRPPVGWWPRAVNRPLARSTENLAIGEVAVREIERRLPPEFGESGTPNMEVIVSIHDLGNTQGGAVSEESGPGHADRACVAVRG